VRSGLERPVRIAATAAAAFGILVLRFSAGWWPENEATRVLHWGLLPIALLLGFAAWVFERSGASTPLRRDLLWGVAFAVLFFGGLRLLGFT
jgi:hypothetical protein